MSKHKWNYVKSLVVVKRCIKCGLTVCYSRGRIGKRRHTWILTSGQKIINMGRVPVTCPARLFSWYKNGSGI